MPRRKKALSPEQIERRQQQAVRFAADVLQDHDLADELSALGVREYAARRGFEIEENPQLRGGEFSMPSSKRELEEERDALLSKLEEIRDAIDDVLDQYEAEDGEEDEGDAEQAD